MSKARRRKAQPYNPAKATDPKVHDRRSSDLVRNARVGVIEIEDPFEHGGKLLAFRNIRNDPLARLHDRKQIDEAQFQGGRAFQHDWEIAERGPQAIDPSKEAVDGGRMPEPITEAQQVATKRLNSVQRQLGLQGSHITRCILIDGATIDELVTLETTSRSTTERWRRYYATRFRECLDSLALAYGFASKPVHIRNNPTCLPARHLQSLQSE
jgi:hypothetical protein